MSAGSAVSRRPPAFQLYASDLLASTAFQDASLAERGLLLTMLLRAWVDDRLPDDSARLAKRLNLSYDDVHLNFGALIEAHFVSEEAPCPGPALVCPDLIRQMSRHAESVRKMSEGGRNGGRKTQEKHRQRDDSEETADSSHPSRVPSSLPSSQASSHPSRVAKAQAKGSELKRTELSRKEKNGKQGEADEEWLAAFEGRKASSGFEAKL